MFDNILYHAIYGQNYIATNVYFVSPCTGYYITSPAKNMANHGKVILILVFFCGKIVTNT